MVFLWKLICVHASGYPSTPDLNSNWCYLGTGIWTRELPGKRRNDVLWIKYMSTFTFTTLFIWIALVFWPPASLSGYYFVPRDVQTFYSF